MKDETKYDILKFMFIHKQSHKIDAGGCTCLSTYFPRLQLTEFHHLL